MGNAVPADQQMNAFLVLELQCKMWAQYMQIIDWIIMNLDLLEGNC